MTSAPEVASPPPVGSGLSRWIEVPVVILALTLALPLLAAIAMLIRVSSTGPIIFRQQRVGRNGDVFTMFKFRTMRVNQGGPGITAGGDPRITAVGRFLRRTKLDELPELWNVVRGDMALVGPRPEVPEYVSLDDPGWRDVLSVRPGITDPTTLSLRNEEVLLAAVEGDHDEYYRNELLPRKLESSRRYLQERTAVRDLGVLIATVWRLMPWRRRDE